MVSPQVTEKIRRRIILIRSLVSSVFENNRQGLSDSGAFDSALRLEGVASTTSLYLRKLWN